MRNHNTILFFSHIVSILRCFISFRLRCKRIRFYVVFAGTCILLEFTQKHLHLNTIWQNMHEILSNANVLHCFISSSKTSLFTVIPSTRGKPYNLLQFVMFGWLAGSVLGVWLGLAGLVSWALLGACLGRSLAGFAKQFLSLFTVSALLGACLGRSLAGLAKQFLSCRYLL